MPEWKVYPDWGSHRSTFNQISLVESWHMTKVKIRSSSLSPSPLHNAELSAPCSSSPNSTVRLWKTIAAAPNTSKLHNRYNKYLLVTVLHLLQVQLQIPTCRAPSQQPHQTPATIRPVHKSAAPYCKRFRAKALLNIMTYKPWSCAQSKPLCFHWWDLVN